MSKLNFAKMKKCFIIAEVSANHGRSFRRAVKMVQAAKAAGADAIKFQTYTADTITMKSDRKYFRVKHPVWGGQTLWQLYNGAYTPWDWFPKLKKVADDEGIIFFSSPFDTTAVDLLEELDAPLYKIASFELVDLSLVEYAAKTGKPLIMSIGRSTVPEIREAIATARKAGAKDIVLLKCVSAYPTPPDEINLRTIPDMIRRFKLPVGLSDHSIGIAAAVAAIPLGATVIEKHFTLSRKIDTPDNFFSIEPAELKQLVDSVRVVEQAMGKVAYGKTPGEKKNNQSRSLFVVRDVKKGEPFTPENVRSIRPDNGLKPRYLKKVFGKKARRRILAGTPLSWELIG